MEGALGVFWRLEGTCSVFEGRGILEKRLQRFGRVLAVFGGRGTLEGACRGVAFWRSACSVLEWCLQCFGGA